MMIRAPAAMSHGEAEFPEAVEAATGNPGEVERGRAGRRMPAVFWVRSLKMAR